MSPDRTSKSVTVARGTTSRHDSVSAVQQVTNTRYLFDVIANVHGLHAIEAQRQGRLRGFGISACASCSLTALTIVRRLKKAGLLTRDSRRSKLKNTGVTGSQTVGSTPANRVRRARCVRVPRLGAKKKRKTHPIRGRSLFAAPRRRDLSGSCADCEPERDRERDHEPVTRAHPSRRRLLLARRGARLRMPIASISGPSR